LQDTRIEVAGQRIAHHAIGGTVFCVACTQHGLVDQFQMRWQQARTRRSKRQRTQLRAGLGLQGIHRRTGDHAVEVLRITLYLHQAHASAGTAAPACHNELR
jgi:hypothetical protein